MRTAIAWRPLFVSIFLLCATTIAFAQTPFWQQTGGPEGGGVWGLAVNANGDLFAAVYRTGVYRSTDNGESWALLNMGVWWPNIGVRLPVVDRHGHLFVGNGRQILTSIDNGDTWMPTSLSGPGEVYAITIRPSGEILAGGAPYGEVYVSADDGHLWTAHSIGAPDGAFVTALAFDSTGRIYAGTTKGLYVSPDNAVSWYSSGLDGYNVRAVGVNVDDAVFASTEGGPIWRSPDYGATWESAGNNYYETKVFAFNSSGHVFGGVSQGTGGIWRSTDNGLSWVRVGLGKVYEHSVHSIAIAPNGNIFAGTTTDGVYRSSDNGESWLHFTRGMKSADVHALAVNALDELFIGVEGRGMFRSGDRGETWTQFYPDPGLESCIAGVMHVALNRQGHIFASWWHRINRSTNNGVDWTRLAIPCCPKVVAINPQNEKEIFAGGYFPDTPGQPVGVMRSMNDGDTWEPLNLPGADVWSLAVDPQERIFAGGIPGVWRSADHGLTWSLLPDFENEYMTTAHAIAVDPNGNVIVSSSKHYATMRSTDGGTTWNVLHHEPAQAIAINSEGRIFLSSAGSRAFSSIDDGLTWQEFGEGLINASVRVFGFDSVGHLYAGLWDGGVMRTVETTFLVKTVAIDIKPGAYPNTINLGSGGTVPVAILSSETFDATTVDPLTVTLSGANVRLKGKGTPMSSFEDINKDGRLDLLVHVETEALELTDTSTEAVLEGKTFSGRRIKGTDTVKVVP